MLISKLPGQQETFVGLSPLAQDLKIIPIHHERAHSKLESPATTHIFLLAYYSHDATAL